MYVVPESSYAQTAIMSIMREPDVVLDRMPATTNNVANRPPRAIVLRLGSYASAYICEYAERPLTLDFVYTLDPTHSNAFP